MVGYDARAAQSVEAAVDKQPVRPHPLGGTPWARPISTPRSRGDTPVR